MDHEVACLSYCTHPTHPQHRHSFIWPWGKKQATGSSIGDRVTNSHGIQGDPYKQGSVWSYFWTHLFRPNTLMDLNLFENLILLTKICLDLNFFWTQNAFRPTIYLYPKCFWIWHFFRSNLKKIKLYGAKIVWDPQLLGTQHFKILLDPTLF